MSDALTTTRTYSTLTGQLDPFLGHDTTEASTNAHARPILADNRNIIEEVASHAFVGTRRPSISVSQIVRYAACRHKFLWADMRGMQTPYLVALRRNALPGQLPANVRGDVIHEYIASRQEAWSDAERGDRMLTILRRLHPLHGDFPLRSLPQLVAEGERFFSHDLYHLVRLAQRRGKRVVHEGTLLWRPHGDIVIEGTPDLVIETAPAREKGAQNGRFTIIDYKTDSPWGATNPDEWAKAKVREHALQAAIYTLGFNAMYGPGAVAKFFFFFTATGRHAEWHFDKDILAEARREITSITAQIAMADESLFGSPQWAVQCETCPWRDMCRPEGIPARYALPMKMAGWARAPGDDYPIRNALTEREADFGGLGEDYNGDLDSLSVVR